MPNRARYQKGWDVKPPPGTPVDPEVSLCAGLIGCWLCGDSGGAQTSINSGAKLFDSSGHGRDGVTSGQPLLVPTGRRGGGLCPSLQAGSTQSLVMPNSAQIAAGDFSIGMWVQIQTNPASLYGLFEGNGSNIQMRVTSTGKFGWSADGNTVVTGNAILTTGIWCFLLFTSRGNTQVAYVNGLPDSTGTQTPNYSGGTAVVFGNLANFYLTGLMDTISIWGRSLNASEALRLWERPFAMFKQSAPKRPFLKPSQPAPGPPAAFNAAWARPQPVVGVGVF